MEIFTDTNYLAVFLAAVSSMVLGFLWYSPLLFGAQWTKLIGWDKRRSVEMQKVASALYLQSFLASLVTAFVLDIFIKLAGASTVLEALKVGMLAWLGFAATTQFTNWLFSGKQRDLFFIDTVYQWFVFVIMSAILALMGDIGVL